MQREKSGKNPHPPNPGRLIARAGRQMMRWGDVQLKPYGFTTSHLPVLIALGDGSAMSQRELTRFAGIEQPSMAQMLARMERDGLIVRKKDPEDSRASLVSLSKAALKRIPQARDRLFQGNEVALRGFDDAEITRLMGMMERIVANLDEALENEEK